MGDLPPGSGSGRRHPLLAALVALSLGFGLLVIAFYDALGATPWDTRDSAGNTMGFNDPFSAEHYEIILRQISPARALGGVGGYGLLLIGAHVTMAALLLRGVRRRWVLGFCALQPAVFFWGVFGLLYLPAELASPIGKDREGFVDMPWVELMAHGAWLYACAAIAVRVSMAGGRRGG